MTYFRSLLFFITLSLFAFKSAIAQNKISQIVDKNKIQIADPYIYDGFVLTQFTMNDKTKLMQTEFTAFKGQEYKLYFCTSGFEDSVRVTVFDTEKAQKGKKEILYNAITNKEKAITFEFNKRGNYTIEYSIPPCENGEYGMTKDECVVVLISYKKK